MEMHLLWSKVVLYSFFAWAEIGRYLFRNFSCIVISFTVSSNVFAQGVKLPSVLKMKVLLQEMKMIFASVFCWFGWMNSSQHFAWNAFVNSNLTTTGKSPPRSFAETSLPAICLIWPEDGLFLFLRGESHVDIYTELFSVELWAGGLR